MADLSWQSKSSKCLKSEEQHVGILKRTLQKSQGERAMKEIVASLFIYRTTPSSALNNHSPAEALIGRKPQRFSTVQLQRNSASPSSDSSAKKTLVSVTAIYLAIKGDIAHWQKVSSEISKAACYTKWISMAKLGASSEPSPLPWAGISSNLKMDPTDFTLVVFDLPLLGSIGTPINQPNNQHILRSRRVRKFPPPPLQNKNYFTWRKRLAVMMKNFHRVDSELRELRRIIDAMAQERSTSSTVLNDQNSAKPPFSPSSMNNLTSSNATTPVANIADNGEMEEETSNSLPPGTPKSNGVRKGGWVSDFMNTSFACFKIFTPT
ncbi:hypothetical protein ACTXT7_015170 [Hymenolepis weldensis]